MARTKIYSEEEARLRKNESQKRYKLSVKGKRTQSKYYASMAKKESSKRWRVKNGYGLMRKAHQLIYRLKKRGLVSPKPCEVCGQKDTFAHHRDYNKPLDIKWLCNYHHSILHRNLMEKER